MTIPIDELLIQRCVDNELSVADRRQLLEQLDASPDGWKTLACTYMEEQLFASAVVDADQQAAAKLSARTVAVAETKRHWLHHPLTSVALSACVAFLLGLLISGNAGSNSSNSSESPMPIMADVKPDAGGSNKGSIASTGSLTDSAPAYRVQLESDGDTLKSIPVFHDQSRYLSAYETQQQRVLNALGRELPRGDSSPQIRFIRLPLQDGRVIVVPVESFQLSPEFQ